jgi:hypothetical protein
MTARIGVSRPGTPTPRAPRGPLIGTPGSSSGSSPGSAPSPGKQTRTGALEAAFADREAAAGFDSEDDSASGPIGRIVTAPEAAFANRASAAPTGRIVSAPEAAGAARKQSYFAQLEQLFGRPDGDR